MMEQYHIEDTGLNSMILLDNGKIYRKSAAALRIARQLSMPWPLLSVFLLVPAFMRDAVYDFIGRHRYQWFGKYEQCYIPDDDTRERFVE